jgi:PAS domain S-box-containing protein
MAEAELARHPVEEPLPATELLHELQVHQIELEMQNEALRQSQIELEAARDRYADLYDFAPVGYLTLTANGMIEEINFTATTLLGVERKNLLKRRFTSLVVAEDQDRWLAFFLQVTSQGGKGSLEVAMQRGDGAVFQVLLDCAPPKVGAGGTALYIAMTDITERKQSRGGVVNHE